MRSTLRARAFGTAVLVALSLRHIRRQQEPERRILRIRLCAPSVIMKIPVYQGFLSRFPARDRVYDERDVSIQGIIRRSGRYLGPRPVRGGGANGSLDERDPANPLHDTGKRNAAVGHSSAADGFGRLHYRSSQRLPDNPLDDRQEFASHAGHRRSRGPNRASCGAATRRAWR